MLWKLRSILVSVFEPLLTPLLSNRVYVARAGLVKGLKRRGGFGFLPKKKLSREHIFLKSIDFEGKTVYDVGGHIGLMKMFFARAVGDQGKVVTFEPNPMNYDRILDHLNLNGFSNVNVVQKGLGNETGKVEFVVTKSECGTADPKRQVVLLENKKGKTLHVEIDTLDNQIMYLNLPKPDFVKIDVEGFELQVLLGMTQTIKLCKPQMHIELHGTSERDIVEFLWHYQYSVRQVEDDFEIKPENLHRVHGHLFVS